MGDGSTGESRTLVAAQRPSTLVPADVAWLALLPCAVVALAAILLLGPPLGHALLSGGSQHDGLWPPGWWNTQGRPEPVEQGRYVLAVLAPLAFAGVLVAGTRRATRLRPRTVAAAALAGQVALVAFVVAAFLGQYGVAQAGRGLSHVFGPVPLLSATALVLVATVALRRPQVPARIARVARETAARRNAGLGVAGAVAAAWLVEGVSTERLGEDPGSFIWTLNDAFAVLAGRTPLVEYHPIYAKLLSYPAALALAAFGKTALVYTIAMAVLSVLALLAVYAVFRLLLGSSLLALGLFVPFVALSDVGHPMTYDALWPMRYGGAYLLAWLSARQIERPSARRLWSLWTVAGFVAIDNQEFGSAALLASLAALAWTRPPRSARDLLRLAGPAAGGALGAAGVVSLFALLRAGALPDPAILTEWPRIFSRLGWFSLPMPALGLHLAIYATLVAAIAVATVRALRSAGNRPLTGMLAWSGVFGLLAGSYFVGRSETLKLVAMLSAWAFALALLTIVTVRAWAAQGWRRPALAQLLVLFGFALAVCSIARFPLPHRVALLTAARPAPGYRPSMVGLVRGNAWPGEHVAILLAMSDRIAYEAGVRNVSPYGVQDEIVTRGQLQALIDAARRAHAHKLFLPAEHVAPQQLDMLVAAGFRPRVRLPSFVELVDG
jgi:hypothetical protein